MSETREHFKVGIITASDKGFRGEREDLSGPKIVQLLKGSIYEVVSMKNLPDDEEMIYRELIRLSDDVKADLILTTGGTGLSPRDHTPEATMRAGTRNVPGIAEAIRAYSISITPRAMLSRSASVERNQTLIINLPGSPKAVEECLTYIMPVIDHGIRIMKGLDGECAR